jgi:ubiquinone/menaquinone biosynthesis C-methylase UbiE
MRSETELARRVYDRLARSYDQRWRTYVDSTLKAVTDGIHLQGTEQVLDIACGTGEPERLLLSRWPRLRIVGTDLSAGMLRQAVGKKLNSNVSWVLAGAAQLSFDDWSFDWAVCASSFHYFRAPEMALKEACRVVRPCGTFVLVDWCHDYLSCKLCSIWLRLTDPAFCRMYTMRACRRMLEQAGFDVLRAGQFRVRRVWGMMQFVCRRTGS